MRRWRLGESAEEDANYMGSAMAGIIYHGEDHNCTSVDRVMKRYYLPASYSIIFMVGFLGNVTSICVYLLKLRPWKSSSIIMVNLALTDLLYVLTLPFLVYYYSNADSWTLGDFMCRFVRFGFHFNLYGSILFLTCHAVFRYVVVMNPLRAAQVQQMFWGVTACSAVWIIAAAEIAPMLTMLSLTQHGNKTYCLDFASTLAVHDAESTHDMRWYSWLLIAIGFLLPLVVVFMCYIGIARKLAEGPCTTTSCRMRARRVTVLILVVFVVCFLPYHVLRALRIEIRTMQNTPCIVERIVHAAYIITRPLAGFNTFFNLALYTLSGDKFREAFFSILYRRCWLNKTTSLIYIISKAGNKMPAT